MSFRYLMNLLIEKKILSVSECSNEVYKCSNFIIFLVTLKMQIIWNEVGETDTDRDKMLLELEQECLEVYRRKVDQANRCRAQLRQAIADSEAELAAICSAMGERPVHIRQVRSQCGIYFTSVMRYYEDY
jgi:hypothetical protein